MNEAVALRLMFVAQVLEDERERSIDDLRTETILGRWRPGPGQQSLLAGNRPEGLEQGEDVCQAGGPGGLADDRGSCAPSRAVVPTNSIPRADRFNRAST